MYVKTDAIPVVKNLHERFVWQSSQGISQKAGGFFGLEKCLILLTLTQNCYQILNHVLIFNFSFITEKDKFKLI